MNKYLRKLWALLIAFTLSVSFPVSAYASFGDTDSDNLATAVNNLKAIGDMVGVIALQIIQYIPFLDNIDTNVTSAVDNLAIIGKMVSLVGSSVEEIEYTLDALYINSQLQLQELDAIYGFVVDDLYMCINSIDSTCSSISARVSNVYTRLGTINNTIGTWGQTIVDKIDELSSELLNGFDSTEFTKTNDALSDSMNHYQQAENEVMSQASSHISKFTPGVLTLQTESIAAIGYVSDIMQGLFVTSGVFMSPVTVSLTLTFVLMLVGYHRFRMG